MGRVEAAVPAANENPVAETAEEAPKGLGAAADVPKLNPPPVPEKEIFLRERQFASWKRGKLRSAGPFNCKTQFMTEL